MYLERTRKSYRIKKKIEEEAWIVGGIGMGGVVRLS